MSKVSYNIFYWRNIVAVAMVFIKTRRKGDWDKMAAFGPHVPETPILLLVTRHKHGQLRFTDNGPSNLFF